LGTTAHTVITPPRPLTGRPSPLGACAIRRCVACGIDWFARVAAGKKIETKEAAMPRAQIKDEQRYRKLRDTGASQEKPARIANAAALRDLDP
jgi:hypothetical protein